MRKISNIITLFLVLTILGLCLSACSKEKRTYNSDNFIEDTSSPKIVKEKITLRMFVPKSPLHGEWEDMALFKKMEEVTNIHVDFEEVAISAYTDKKSFKWNDSKNPIDAFFLANTLGEITMSKDKLYSLNEDIEKYAPNYKRYLEKYPEMKRITTLEDGNMYTFSTINIMGGDSAKQYINVEWLKELGLPIPNTIDEYYNALKAFKNNDMNGNNRYDEIPLSYITADQSKNFLMSAFGYVGTGIEVNNSNDEIVYVPTTNNYREYLKFTNKLYNEGLIDKNIYSNKESDLAYKGKKEMLGSFSSSGAFLVVGNELDNDYSAIPPLTSTINDEKVWYQFGYQCEPTTIMIPKSTPYHKEIVRWMDMFYSEEFEILQSYGEEKIHWSWDNEEKTGWQFNIPENMEREQYRATITYQAGLGGAIVLTDFGRKESSPQNQKIYSELAIYEPYMKVPIPILHFNREEMQVIADLEAQLNTYMVTTEANFIKGILDPNNDKDWNKHINALNKIGVDKLVEIYQNRYSQYK